LTPVPEPRATVGNQSQGD